MARAFFREILRALSQHRLKDMAAQMAFWSLLALFPFCMFLLTIAGFIPLRGIEDELLGLLHEIMPMDAWSLFDKTVHEILNRQHGGILVVSLIAALWSASSGMSSMRQALNLAWGVTETRPWWRIRARSLIMIVCAALLIVIALIGLLLGPGMVREIYNWFGMRHGAWRLWLWLRWPVVALDVTMMLGLLYHFLPNVKRPFRLFTPGSMAALAIWVTASVLFRVYVSHFNAYARTYGTLGAAIILLLWLYISSATVILGCEINAAIVRLRRQPGSA